MNAETLMQTLFDWCQGAPHDYTDTCDTLKCGDAHKELHKVAVTMFPTPHVIRAAHDWGADLLIVHEPTFYDHFEQKADNDPVIAAKEKLLAETGMTIWRYHDHPHVKAMDMICEGELTYLGLKGAFVKNQYLAVNRFRLDEPITARQLAKHMEDTLHIKHVRIAGTLDKPARNLSLCFGATGHHTDELRDPEVDMVLAGETCEWSCAQYACEANQLGFSKALLVMGHIPSERDGMRLLNDWLQERFPQFESRYFECGEAYSYQELD